MILVWIEGGIRTAGANVSSADETARPGPEAMTSDRRGMDRRRIPAYRQAGHPHRLKKPYWHDPGVRQCYTWCMKRFIELFSWYGTGAIVLAYALVSFSVFQPTNIIYQLLNGSGALAIVVVSFRKHAYQPGVLNIIWTLIALVAIVNILF